MKHDTIIDDDVLREFARKIGDLRYDQVCDFIRYLAKKLSDDALNDARGGRHKLANTLLSVTEYLFFASDCVAEAWEICESKMP